MSSLKMNLSLDLPSAVDNPIQTGDATPRRNCKQLSRLFDKIASGNLSVGPDGRLGSKHAYASIAVDTSSGAVTVQIDRTTVSATANGTDDANGTAVAALINANATLKTKVKAKYVSDTVKKVIVEALVMGSAGNYSLAVTGTGYTASGTALTLGTDTSVLDFRTSGVKAFAWLDAPHTVTGNQTVSIGGTSIGAVTATLGVGDTYAGHAAAAQTLHLLATAINANTTVNKWVQARVVPACDVVLTDTTADTMVVTINGIANTITASATENTTGASLVTAINAQTELHGCTASYVASGQHVYIHPQRADARTRIAVSGAGMGTSAAANCATQTILCQAVEAGTATTTIDGVACTITSADQAEDTFGAAMVIAINAKTSTHGCFATYTDGTDTLAITSQFPGSEGNAVSLAISGAGYGTSSITGSAVLFDKGADRCVIECLVPGVIGNAIALSVTAGEVVASAAQLSGGSESRVAYTL